MKLHKLYSVLCAASVALAFVGCGKDDTIIDQLNSQQVYFPNDMIKTIELSAEKSSVEIPVMRIGTDAASIPLKVAMEENVAGLNIP